MAAAEAMLDEMHDQLPNAKGDRNAYILGRIGAHNIVITCLPAGIYGTSSATATAIQMRFTYGSIQCCLVGIGGGAPSAASDIRLGDVVVSEPTMSYGGVIQYDHGKALDRGHFIITGTSDKPPEVLLRGLNRLKARHMVHGSTIHLLSKEALSRYPHLQKDFQYPGEEGDLLFLEDYRHGSSASSCKECNTVMLHTRPRRLDSKPRIFYGLIASANKVIRDASLRDQLSQRHGILCFEMEAAGLMNTFPCLVIRGVCDYSDSHKNERWQGYAAIIAAAYAKELVLSLSWYDTRGRVNANESLIHDPFSYEVKSLAQGKDSATSDPSSSPSPTSPPPLPQHVTGQDIGAGSIQVNEQKSTNDERNNGNFCPQENYTKSLVLYQSEKLHKGQFDQTASWKLSVHI